MNLTEQFDKVADIINDLHNDINGYGWAEHEQLVKEGNADIERLRHAINTIKEHLQGKSKWGILE